MIAASRVFEPRFVPLNLDRAQRADVRKCVAQHTDVFLLTRTQQIGGFETRIQQLLILPLLIQGILMLHGDHMKCPSVCCVGIEKPAIGASYRPYQCWCWDRRRCRCDGCGRCCRRHFGDHGEGRCDGTLCRGQRWEWRLSHCLCTQR